MGYFFIGFDEGMGLWELRVYIKLMIELVKWRIWLGEMGVKMLCFVSVVMVWYEMMEKGVEWFVIYDVIFEKVIEVLRIGFELLKEWVCLEGVLVLVEDGENIDRSFNFNFGMGGVIFGVGNFSIFGLI